jgi:WD40 repeat protein
MAEAGDVFGDWLLLRLLAEGAFSTVFLARHQERDIYAAVKVWNRHLEEPEAAAYVEQKRRLMRLHHPHLVRVLAVGVQEGRPFLAMEYAPHGTLRERHPPGERVPLELVLAYLQQIAPALADLHQHHLTHGDIRPGKFLIGDDGRLVMGDSEPPLEVLGSGYRSPRRLIEGMPYLAPEHRRVGQRLPLRELEQAADQFALGSVLYTWLAGRPPFSEGLKGAASTALAFPPPSLQQSVPALPKEVEEVVFKALEENPQDRFVDITALARAFERACLPRRASPLPRPDPPEAASGTSDASSILSTYEGHTGTITSLAWAPDGKRLASASGDRTVRVWDAATGQLLLPYAGHQAPVLAVDWSPAPPHHLASASVDGAVHVWTAAPHRVVAVCQVSRFPISALAWSPDGQFLAVGVGDEVQLWRATAPGEAVARYAQGARVQSVAWSPFWPYAGGLEAATLASGGDDAHVHVWTPGSRKPALIYTGQRSPVGAVAWSPDGVYVASGGRRTVQVWRAKDGERVFATPLSRASGLPAVSWQPRRPETGRGPHWRLAVTGFEATVEVWEVEQQKPLRVHTGHAGLGLAVAWSPEGTRVASGGFDQQVQVWRPV